MKKLFFILNFIIIISYIYCNTLNDIIDKTVRFNKWDDAKKQLESYLSNNPVDSFGYSIYAAVLNELKLYDEAIIAVRNAINYENSNEKKGLLYFDLGTYYYNKGLKDVAVQNYNKSLEYNSNIDSTYYMLGTIYYENKDYDRAILNWKKYVEITANADKRAKMQAILAKFEKQLMEKKLKEEEEKRLREEFLNKIKEELSKDQNDSKSLETDKNKTQKSKEMYEEID
jgi:tetratricopeptide (TPR) repeat protein